MTAILNIFKTSPYKEEIQDEKEVKGLYRYWRIRVFYSMYIGYAFYYFTRKSFTFAMPTLMQDLGFTKSDLGILASILWLTYGLSKFVNGILGDKSNPRFFMSTGLILTGLFNIFFSFSSSLLLFALFWGLNGWFQGFGWPSCARLLVHWYSQSERGRWWSFWNTSHNIGGAIIPIVIGFVAQYYGWRMAMVVPGVICIFVGLYLMNRLCDTPQSLGLPPIEKFRDDYPAKKTNEPEHELTVRQILFEYVLKNPYIWILAISYFFVYVIRIAANDWTVLYLVESKGYSQLAAGSTVTWFEVGGFFGSLAAGWSADTIFRGKRGPVNVLFCLFTVLSIGGLWYSPPGGIVVDSLCLFFIGFFIFGPQMLIGMVAAELSHKKAAATASGFSGWIGYFGAASAGYPLGVVTQEYGWEGFFFTLSGCGIIAALLLLPLWNVRSRQEGIFGKEEEELPPDKPTVEKITI